MPRKDGCAVSGSKTDVNSHCRGQVYVFFGVGSNSAVLGKHIDVACLVPYKCDLASMQTWDVCYIDVVQCKSATESHQLARWSQAGVCFLWGHVLAVCWHPLAHTG